MPISGKEAIKRLQKKHNFEIARQRGSHVVLTAHKNGKKYTTVVPLHKELKVGTRRSIARLADIPEKDLK